MLKIYCWAVSHLCAASLGGHDVPGATTLAGGLENVWGTFLHLQYVVDRQYWLANFLMVGCSALADANTMVQSLRSRSAVH
jgi:hypothetical protein